MTHDVLASALWGIAVIAVLGLVFGFALAVTAARFQVQTNPLVDSVREQLPSANCGACGFAGCQAYAEAVVERADVQPTLCIPGRASVASAVAELTGKVMGAVQDRIVLLRCHGTSAFAKTEAEYAGISTCAAASLVFGGPKACKNGCLGLADCVRACPFDALTMSDESIPVVHTERCTGCGICVTTCPKGLFDLYPRDHRIELSCVARDKSSVVRSTCEVGCTLCRKCVAKCPATAIEWNGATIVIDHATCIAYGPGCAEVCVDVCPSTILHRLGQRPHPEAEQLAPASA